MATTSFFATAPFIPPDAIFALTAQYNLDKSPLKVNLGQGTYRDENALPWVLHSVRESRKQLAAENLLHEYLPILGHPEFRRAAAELVLGNSIFSQKNKQLATCQSVSGTGALHLAGLFLRRCCGTSPEILIPEPTWMNHVQVFSSLGFKCRLFKYYDSNRGCIDMESYTQTLKSAAPGSIVVLHACAHNPTGYDPTPEQWKLIGNIIKERNLFPLFDAAYLGFNSGNVDNDAFAIRHFVGELGLETAICMSFAKNMGLYGERVGCFVVNSATEEIAKNSQSVLEQLQRSEISNPPAYGAKIASKILNDKSLRNLWYEDLVIMSSRIRSMRQALFNNLVTGGASGTWNHLIEQSGMFGFLGLPRDVVIELKDKYHIYMAENSRISISGLNERNVAYVAQSITRCLLDRARGTTKVGVQANL